VVVLPVRSRALPGLPVERGRSGRPVQPEPGLVLRAGLLERARSDPERADLRARQRRGQPRRGRQGLLVVRGRHSYRFLALMAIPLPAGRVPLHQAARGERRTVQGPRRVRIGGHRDLRRGPVLLHHRGLRQGFGAHVRHPPDRLEPRARARHPARAAAPVAAQHVGLGTRIGHRGRGRRGTGRRARGTRTAHRQASALLAGRAGRRLGADAHAAAVRQRDQRRAALRRRERLRLPEGRDRGPRRARRRDRESQARGHEGRAALRARTRSRRSKNPASHAERRRRGPGESAVLWKTRLPRGSGTRTPSTRR
jgi:hypothetical protein